LADSSFTPQTPAEDLELKVSAVDRDPCFSLPCSEGCTDIIIDQAKRTSEILKALVRKRTEEAQDGKALVPNGLCEF
jgi:hypothetical protein